jgi:hypothetical protein
MLNTPCIQFWPVMGTPQELGTFTPHHAEVQITAAFGDPKYLRRCEHHYDFEVDTTSPSMPKSFGGVSGGGLLEDRFS